MTTDPIWTKICGVRDVETARVIAGTGASAIGLNFYAPSPRAVAIDVARAIVEAVGQRIDTVGLFVNHPLDEVVTVCRSVGCSQIQLHGDEDPGFMARLRERLPETKMIRAFRMNADNLEGLRLEFEACSRLDAVPHAWLVDAFVAGVFGGSGRSVDWDALADNYDFENWPSLILAGGLNADNVAQAVRRVRPWGVDVASGVEAEPGVKDAQRVAGFVQSARAAAQD